jgi:ABC-type sugar transport system permease subunit
MSYWRSVKFWAVFLVLILPSSVMFALPGAMFVEESAFERWAPLILPLQAFVTIAVPYVIASLTFALSTADPRYFNRIAGNEV